MRKTLKFGKQKPSYDHRDLLMAHYVDLSKLPPLPEEFGHEDLVQDWGMLANNEIGNCTVAGGMHETMLFTAVGDPDSAVFDDACAKADYAAISGWVEDDPNTDQGADMHAVMNYRRNIGLIDVNGKRHKIGAYVWLEPGNYEHMLIALRLFTAVGVGVSVPNSAMDQFASGLPWSIVGGSEESGRHYVPYVAKREMPRLVTWGKLQYATPDWYRKYNDETIAILSREAMINGVSAEGFRFQELIRDLARIRK